MKKLLNLACLAVLLLAAASCQKDNPKSVSFLYRQWEVMNQDATWTSFILDISKKQFIYRGITEKSLQAPEIPYDDSHIYKIHSVTKIKDAKKGEVWDIEDDYDNHYYIFDVTKNSAKMLWYSLEDDGYWELLRPIEKSIKMRYHYVPVSAVDLGLSVYWAMFDIHDTYNDYEDFDPDTEYYNNYGYDETEDWVYQPGNFYAWTEVDPVHAKFGGKWRMPTQDEWNELFEKLEWYHYEKNADFKWESYDGSATKPGYEYEYISFVMNGYYIGSSQKSKDYGYFWTGTSDGASTALVARFRPDASEYTRDLAEISRTYKCNIRPVWDPNMK